MKEDCRRKPGEKNGLLAYTMNSYPGLRDVNLCSIVMYIQPSIMQPAWFNIICYIEISRELYPNNGML